MTMRHLNTFLTSFLLFLTFALANFNIALAQQLPNASFEQWHEDSTWGTQPDNWSFSNVSQAGFEFNIGERTTDAHSGSYAIKCQDKEVGAMGITEVSPSWITLGTPWAYLDGLKVSSATAGTYGGINWSYRPDTLAVWVKRTTSGNNEDMNLVYYSWKGTAYNDSYKNKNNGCTTTSKTDEESDICKSDANECKSPWGDAVQIAEGWLRTRTNYGNWTLVKVPIKYFNNDVPTKMNIILSGSNYPNKRANSGLYTTSVLIADDVTMIYGSDIHELYFDGEKYSKFNKDKKELYYEVPAGMSIPDIVCKRSGRILGGKEISITAGVKDGAPATITVTAEDKSSTSVYKIYFVSTRDKNPYPATIKVNGTAIAGFNALVSDYTVTLPYGTTEQPTIEVVKANNKQTYTLEPFTVPGTAKITVYAEDEEYKALYNIKFETGKLSDTTLEDIQVNGVSIEGFLPTKTVYKVNVPVGTTESPVITYTSAYEPGAQTVVVDRKGIDETSTVTVSAPGAVSSRVYKISYNITESTYSYLKDLKVGGVTIDKFAPSTLNYTYPLPLGTTVVPAVTYTAGDAYQTITKEDGGLDGITKITVKAQNGINTSIYRISFPLTKSSNSKLSDLKVAGETIEGFSANITSYSYKLATGTTALPEISWTQGDAYQTVKATYGGVNGTTKIVVTAQDGNATVYTIAFSVDQATNSTLKDIQLDGVSLEDFAPEKTEYSILLARGTKTLPVITCTPHDEFQKITKVEGGVNGDTRITVKAQSGDATVYTLSFSVDKSDNSYLSDIKVAGVSLEGFAPDKFNYDYKLAAGTTSVPEITYTLGDAYQKVALVKGTVNSATTIKVTAETGAESTYTINFSVEKSANANLKDILLDGVSVEGFDPDTYYYTVALPEGATSSPVITVEKEATQTVTITKPQLYGEAYINVVPEEGSRNVYTVKFTANKSGNCSLSDIKVAGESVEGFNPDVTTYEITLAQGTTTLPLITYTKGEESQRVEMVEGGIDGVSTISVMAENGSIKIYSLSFSTVKSSNGLLSDIKVDGTSIEGFASDKYEYTYVMAKSVTERPLVSAVKADAASRVDAVIPYLDGDVKFYVKSEDGTSESLYTVHLVYAKDTNVNLSEIKVNGTAVALAEGQYTYDIYGSFEKVPSVTFTKSEKTQRVVLNNNISQSTLYVKAEDGSSVTYTLNYNKVYGSSALLSDLQYFDGTLQKFVSVEGFASDKFDYEITLPVGAADVYTLNCIGVEKNQTYKIRYASFGEVTKINVTSEDGTATADYSVRFIAGKSSVCTLDDISLDGVTIAGFDPEVTEYNFTVTKETSARGAIGYLKSDAKALVTVTDNVFDKQSVIKVTAEDGTVKSYVLNFNNGFEGKANVLKSISISGTPISDFASDKFEYTIPSNVGGAVPTVSYEKTSFSQTVYTAFSGRNDVLITVKANQDGAPDAVYTLHIQKDEAQYNVLSAIKVNGSVISGFDSNKYKYVVSVTDQPSSVTAVVAAGGTAVKSVNEISHVQFVTPAKGALKSVTYDVYFHYTNDIIPNEDFEDWTTPKYNADRGAVKPTGWNCPADATDKKKLAAASLVCFTDNVAYTGTEVYKSSTGSAAKLSTKTYQCCLAGEVPSVLTLGNISCELKVASQTTVGFSGGITFRNTPDVASIKYKYTDDANDGAQFAFRFFDASGAETKKDILFPDKISEYTVYDHPLQLGSLQPVKMNIAITPNGNKFSGITAVNEAELYVDYVKYIYNSTISAIKVNGVDVEWEGNEGTVTIDKESALMPQFEITGEVEDQMYNIDYGTEINGKRTVKIRSYAEDMTYTDYTVVVTRPVVTSALSSIKVDGTEIPGFKGDVLDYTIYLPVGNHYMPDVVAEGSSSRLKVSMSVSGSVVTIKSKSDISDELTYTVTFVEDELSNANLTSLQVDGRQLDITQTEHSIELAARTTSLPDILYTKVSDKQSVTLTEGGVNGTTSISIKSADKTAEKVYKINFTVAENTSTTSKLSSISVVDAVEQIAFDPDVKEYTYSAAEDENPITNYSRAFREDAMEVTINKDSVVWSLSNALSQTENEYKLKYEVVRSDNSHLAGLILAGEDVEEFNPNLTEYSLSVSRNEVPTLEAVPAVDGQSIETIYDESAETYTIRVTSPDGAASTTYNVAVSVAPGTEAKAASITLAGVQIEGFDPDVTLYNVDMPEGTVKVPEIYGYNANGGSSASLTVKPIDDLSEMAIASEDGHTLQSYYIGFKVAASDDATLKRISSDFAIVEGFAPDRFEYTVTVPSGADDPVITYLKGNEKQSVNEVYTTDGVMFEVTSESGAQTNIYTVIFERTQSQGSDLSGITLDGVSLEGFSPSVYEYSVELPEGTTVLPLIETVSGDNGQKVSVVTNGVNGDAVITSVSQDGLSTSVYTISFSVAKSANSYLNMIFVDGAAIDGFAPEKLDYNVKMEFGATVLPEVTYVTGHAAQVVSKSIEGTTVTLNVKAENGSESNYNVAFELNLSKADTLKMIYVNGDEINEFKPSVTDYTVVLPLGTDLSKVTVDYQQSDEWQLVTKNATESGVQIVVTAQDITYSKTYNVTLEVEKSTNTRLLDLMSNGVTVPGFDPEVFDYYIELPIGTKVIPDVTYTAGDEYQTIVKGESEDRKTQAVNVTAQNGDYSTYTVNYTVLLSSNANLKSISLGDERQLIPSFDEGVYVYGVELPYGTETVPAISYEKAEEAQSVTTDYTTDVNGTSYIYVTAEDGATKQTYSIAFHVAKSNITTLDMIYYNGKEVEGFDKSHSDYNIELPFGTTEQPVVTFDLTDDSETASLTMTAVQTGGWEALISITAENESDQNEYKVVFTIGKDSENRLSSVTIFGKALEDFNPDVNNYEVLLPVYSDSSLLPKPKDIDYVKMSQTESVKVSQPAAGGILIAVTAQNGVVRNYVIKTTIELSDNTDLTSLMVNGKEVGGFSSDVYEYTYIVPFGTAAIDPEKYVITYTMAEPQGQSVDVYADLDDPFLYWVKVTAQDETKAYYSIRFVADIFDPTQEPSEIDVCISSTQDGGWKFATKCKNVVVVLTDLTGKFIAIATLPVVDPNIGEICNPDAEGYVYYAPQDELVIYNFIYAQKKKVKAGKFKGIRR